MYAPERDEVINRAKLPVDADGVTMQGEYSSNRFKDSNGVYWYPVIWRGQRFKKKAWGNGRR